MALINRRRTLPIVTNDYRRDGFPMPLAGGACEQAARAHFAATPMSGGAWRGWAYAYPRGGTSQQILTVQITRDLRVEYQGIVPTKVTTDLVPNDRVYIAEQRHPLTVVDVRMNRRKLYVGLKPQRGGVYSSPAAPNQLWILAV